MAARTQLLLLAVFAAFLVMTHATSSAAPEPTRTWPDMDDTTTVSAAGPLVASAVLIGLAALRSLL